MQDIIGSTPRNTAEKFTNFGLKEGFQEACSLILRKDLTELVETYKVNIIFFPFTSTRQMKQTRKNMEREGKGREESLFAFPSPHLARPKACSQATRQLRTSIHMVRKELENVGILYK